MPKKKRTKRGGWIGRRISLYPLSADRAVRLLFRISPADVKKILANSRERNKARSPDL